MSSSHDRWFEDAEKEVRAYKSNYNHLNRLNRELDDSIHKHDDLIKKIDLTLTGTSTTLKSAETFIYTYKDSPVLFRFLDLFSPNGPTKEYEALAREMEDNNRQVLSLRRQIQQATSPQQPASFLRYKHLKKRPIPFTEPYDEGLCEFLSSDLESRA